MEPVKKLAPALLISTRYVRSVHAARAVRKPYRRSRLASRRGVLYGSCVRPVRLQRTAAAVLLPGSFGTREGLREWRLGETVRAASRTHIAR